MYLYNSYLGEKERYYPLPNLVDTQFPDGGHRNKDSRFEVMKEKTCP